MIFLSPPYNHKAQQQSHSTPIPQRTTKILKHKKKTITCCMQLCPHLSVPNFFNLQSCPAVLFCFGMAFSIAIHPIQTSKAEQKHLLTMALSSLFLRVSSCTMDFFSSGIKECCAQKRSKFNGIPLPNQAQHMLQLTSLNEDFLLS